MMNREIIAFGFTIVMAVLLMAKLDAHLVYLLEARCNNLGLGEPNAKSAYNSRAGVLAYFLNILGAVAGASAIILLPSDDSRHLMSAVSAVAALLLFGGALFGRAKAFLGAEKALEEMSKTSNS